MTPLIYVKILESKQFRFSTKGFLDFGYISKWVLKGEYLHTRTKKTSKSQIPI